MKSGAKEQTAAMEEVLAQLNAANDGFGKAQEAWGGRRDEVIFLVDQAKLAVIWDRPADLGVCGSLIEQEREDWILTRVGRTLRASMPNDSN